jgi:hypothetical protein
LMQFMVVIMVSACREHPQAGGLRYAGPERRSPYEMRFWHGEISAGPPEGQGFVKACLQRSTARGQDEHSRVVPLPDRTNPFTHFVSVISSLPSFAR